MYETKLEAYMEGLIRGSATFQGVMRRKNKITLRPNVPFKHQRRAVEKWVRHNAKGSEFLLLNHDMGTGKSAVLMQMYAKLSVQEERKIKMLVSVPIATLEQWQDTITGWTTIKQDRILVTNDPKKVTVESIANKSIVVLSHSCLMSIFKKCYEFYPCHHRVPGGRGVQWCSAWDLKQNSGDGDGDGLEVDALPPFGMAWDIMAVDEAHVNVNVKSKICNTHAMLAKTSKFRVMMTGTVCMNRPADLAGIAKAGNAVSRISQVDYQSVKVWSVYKNSRDTVNRQNVDAFRKEFICRHKLDASHMQMPTLIEETCAYKVYLNDANAIEYQNIIDGANQLRRQMARNDNGRGVMILMQSLTRLSHFLISPLLARLGAKEFASSQANFVEAIREPSNSVVALAEQILLKMDQGHRTVVVACASVIEMKIAKFYMENDLSNDYGQMFLYTGQVNQKQRMADKDAFLASGRGVMFLSISAGGTGLHLVPGCACMIFFGMMSYSPAVMQQCMARIYRYGQTQPVSVVYVLAYGSSEYAIGSLHADKSDLMKFVQDNYTNVHALQPTGAVWKHTLKIVDNCSDLYDCTYEYGAPTHFEFNQLSNEVVLAVMMAHHERLGANSVLAIMPIEMLLEMFGIKIRIAYHSLPSMPVGAEMVRFN